METTTSSTSFKEAISQFINCIQRLGKLELRINQLETIFASNYNHKSKTMKKILMIGLLLITGIAQGQNNYEEGMNKAFENWKNNNTSEAVNLFERIAAVETTNWIPLYYGAQINIINSFMTKNEKQLQLQLGKAQDMLDAANSISPENPEIMVLQGLLYTAWIAFDGATYGPTLAPEVATIYAKAQAIAPKNPRVALMKADWEMGSARYFGKDTAPFCKDVEHALTLLEEEKTPSKFYPSWGSERAIQILNSCSENPSN